MLQRIGERTYLIKGSPNTLLHEAPEALFVIDPGSEPDRGKLIAKEVERSFNGEKIEVLLSHSHPDHVAALATLGPGLEPYISEQEVSSLIDVRTRRALTYSASAPSNMLYRFVEYSPGRFKIMKLGSKLEDVDIVDLRGHSLGHAGFLTSDGVFYVGDAFFGDRLIASVGVPYYLDYENAVYSLKRLKEIVNKVQVIVMGHGLVARCDEALEIIDMNIDLMEGLKEKVMHLCGLTDQEITYRLLKEANVKVTESSLILSGVTVRSLLGYLAKEGLIQAEVSEKGITWIRKSN